MTYNNKGVFISEKVRDDKTGNFIGGTRTEFKHLDIRQRKQEYLRGGVQYNFRNFLSVKSQKEIPKNATLEVLGKEWKMVDGSYQNFTKNRGRKWCSARYIEIGDN